MDPRFPAARVTGLTAAHWRGAPSPWNSTGGRAAIALIHEPHRCGMRYGLQPRTIRGYGEGMTIEAIKEAISGLPSDERHSVAFWLNELEYDAWDRQMVRDWSAGGRGEALLERVRREIAEGQAIPFEEGLSQARGERLLPRQ